MIIIGLCGRSGSGKSTVASYFQTLGYPVIDTDALYHEILAEKGDCVKELVSAFGNDILAEDGSVCRRSLAEKVFTSDESEFRRKILNEITHKHVLLRVQDETEKMKSKGEKAVFIDVPLLFESGFDKQCDYVVAVVSKDASRINRLRARDGLSEKEITARIGAQLSDEYLTVHSDFVIYNDKDLSYLYEQGKLILQKMNLEVLS